jgi:putative ABC transport system ATP-binding protein
LTTQTRLPVPATQPPASLEPRPAGGDAVLWTVGLRRDYRVGGQTVTALDGVDLAIRPAEFVAVMGPSGSGKSTLLHLMGGLDRPTSGSVVLAGEALEALDDDALTRVRRRRIGFVFQFFNLVPTLSAEENVALPLLIDGQDLAAAAGRLDELFELVGLGDRRGHRPDQLSGGEQQRVAIARAFVARPEVVLADEPTGNLDSRTGREVLDLLRRAADERGQTLVMVTHDPVAAAWTDRVLFLRDGRLVDEAAVGGHADAASAARILDRLAVLEMAP